MSGEWRDATIGSVCEIYDGPHATPVRREEGLVYLGISNLSHGRIDLSAVDCISEEEFSKWTKRVAPNAGDVVFSYETRLGEAALIPTGLRCCLGRRMGLMRPNVDFVEGRFLLYYYLGPGFQETLRSRTVQGSTVERISLTEFPSFPITLPPLPEQRRIAKILGDLDDKIELNRTMNETLEQMARALFKSWFVDFDPVRAKMEGRTPTGMDAATAALFPARLVDSELGPIPEGWEVKAFGEIFQSRTERVGERILPEYSCSNSGVLPRSDKYKKQLSASLSNNRVVRRGDFVFGLSRAILNFGVMNDEVGCVSPAYKVLTVKNTEIHHEILYWMMLAWHDYYYGLVSGSSREGQSVSSDAFNQVHALIPTLGVQAQWLRIREALAEQQFFLTIQSRTLSTLRDTLLPKLVSGEVVPSSS